MVRVKKGIYGARLHPVMAIWAMCTVVNECMEEAGFTYEISSGVEGEHMVGSLHLIGHAGDWAVRSVVVGNQGHVMAGRVKDRLNEDFDIEWNDQKKVLHTEFQPKQPYGKIG